MHRNISGDGVWQNFWLLARISQNFLPQFHVSRKFFMSITHYGRKFRPWPYNEYTIHTE